MNTFSHFRKAQLLVALTCFSLCITGTAFCSSASSAPDPWPRGQLLAPQTLAEALRRANNPKPIIVCVGFQFAYESDHIVGALLKGPTRTAIGVESLRKWAQTIPKNTPVVIYCGCCPLKECPNVRPAYIALRRAGLTHVQVLDLERSFITDWIRQGYPVERVK